MNAYLNKIVITVLFFWIGKTGNAQETDSLPCEEYSREVLMAMVTPQADLMEFYISLADYNRFIDESNYLDEKRDALKLEAIEHYKDYKKAYRKECRRIKKVFSSFEKLGGMIAFDSCRLKISKENGNIAIITCFYKTQLKGQENIDSVSFEVIQLNGAFFIIDGFFDEFSKVEKREYRR